MSNAKYAPAAQHDPDDYAQAPPSYQAEGSSASAGTPLFGEARSDEDNLPDDFKVRAPIPSSSLFPSPLMSHPPSRPHTLANSRLTPPPQFGGSVAEATIDIRNTFVRKVYAILTAQLLATTALSSASFWSPTYKSWIQSHPALVWVSLLGAMVFMGLTYWKRKSYPTNLLFLSGFTALEAYTVSVIVSFYEAGLVLNALVITLGVFVFLTAFACQTKYDFTSWMPYLFGALWGLLIFGFVAAFLPYSSTGELIWGGLGALIFSGYILVDTQMVLRKHHVEEEIAAAMSLYLDVINLFLAILRILNSQSD